MLALPISLAAGVPFRPMLLARTRETNTQVGLSAVDRHQNVAGAFTARPVRAMDILVIDDVITTGSTMNACAQALLSAGASSVYGLSFARAILPDHQVQSDPIS
jgi:predicted amidophosphoribosyltransferase